jgi:hypothetical protein
MFAANPDAFLGFHMRHFQQPSEHAKFVPSRDCGQRRDGLCNE